MYPDGRQVPPPLLAWNDLRNKNTIAQYDLFEDEFGLIGKITFNTAHYIDRVVEKNKIIKVWERARYYQLETAFHEAYHLDQQIGRGKDPYKHWKHHKETHNKEWHAMARGGGLNTEGPDGIHVKPATPGSPIDLFAKRHLIYPPPGAYEQEYDGKTNWAYALIYKDKEKPKSRSTLTKYECSECHLAIRVGIKSDPEIVHWPCTLKKGETVFFVRSDTLAQVTLGLNYD